MHANVECARALSSKCGSVRAPRGGGSVRARVMPTLDSLPRDSNTSGCSLAKGLVQDVVQLGPGRPAGPGAITHDAKVVAAYPHPRVLPWFTGQKVEGHQGPVSL